jgi:outer membrane protein OmpA-like peptidoglycan-associated protein
LERLAALCPRCVDALFALGDSYFKEGQTGMAIETYKKGLAVEDNRDTRLILTRAEEFLEQYQPGEKIDAEQVRKVLRGERTMSAVPGRIMAPLRGFTTRKADRVVSIQANQVPFDEWKFDIRKDFEPLLRTIGEALQEEFSRDATLALLIEGHTDRRGPLDRNEKLSRDRADAIKAYLVQHFGVSPERIVTKGYGPTKPFSPTDDAEGWRLNRRVEFKKADR